MAQSLKRASSPLFYDVESDTLYPVVKEKRGRYEDICRVCASPSSIGNDFVDIFSRSGKAIKIHTKINRFLPITVTVNDGLTHMICAKCRDILNSFDTLFFICEKADEFFQQVADDLEIVQEFDGDTEELDLPFENTSPNIQTKIVKCDSSSRKHSKKGASRSLLITGEKSKITIVEPSTTWVTDDSGVRAAIVDIDETTGDIFEDSDHDGTEQIFSDSEEEYDDDLENPDFLAEDSTSKPKRIRKLITITCQLCNRTAKHANSATSHYKKYHNMHMCCKCFAPFQTIDDLRCHKKIHKKDTRVRRKVCKTAGKLLECSEYFESDDDFEDQSQDIQEKENTRRNVRKTPTKGGEEPESLECDENFDSNADFKDHAPHTKGKVDWRKRKTSTKVSDEPENFECKYCDDILLNKTGLKSHLKFTHQVLMCFECCKTYSTQKEFETHLTEEDHGMVCKICKFDCWSQYSWESHVKTHYSYEIVHVIKPSSDENSTELDINEITYMVMDKNIIENGTQNQPKKFPFKCNLCDLVLFNSTAAFIHYKKHDQFMCSFCSILLPTQEKLKEHTENQHTYLCPICPFKVISLNVVPLKDHLQKDHTDIYSNTLLSVQCGLCNKRMKKSNDIVLHMKSIHKKVICCICSKSFVDEESYKNHATDLENHENSEFQVIKKRQLMVRNRPKIDSTTSKNTEQNRTKKHDTETVKFPCKLCDMVCSKQFFFKRHYLQFHNKFYCLPCDNAFDTHSEIDNHCLTVHGHHTYWQYQCPICSSYFETEKAVTLHVKTIHEKTIKRFECDYCSREYSKKEFLWRHLSKFHGAKEKPLDLKLNLVVECDICKVKMKKKKIESHIKEHTQIKDVLCTHCGKMYLTTEKLKIHIANVHYKDRVEKVDCPQCLFKMPKFKLEKHINDEHVFEWSYVCNHCQLSFKSEDDAQSHCNTEHGSGEDKPFKRISQYQCEICQIYTGNAAKLQTHKYINHKKTSDPPKHKKFLKTYCCEQCGDIVKYTSKVYHDYVKHNIPLKYPCGQCERSFQVITKRDQHIQKYHGRERNFACDLCEKKFVQPKTLYTHKLRVHFDGYKGLPCPFCDKKFKSIHGQTKHIKMHTANMPHRCETCDLGFHIKTAYVAHMQRHEKNLPILPPWRRRVEVLVRDVDLSTIINT